MLTDEQRAESLQNLADAAESCDLNGLDTSAGDIRAAMAAFRAALDTIRDEAGELARLRSEVHMYRTAAVPAMARFAEELALLRPHWERKTKGVYDAQAEGAEYGEWRERFGGQAT